MFAVIFFITTILFVDVRSQSGCTTLRAEPGVCVPILTCDSIVQLLSSSIQPLPASIIRIVQRSHCGTFNNVNYVCCERNRVTGGGISASVTRTTTTTRRPAVEPESKICPSVTKSETDLQVGMEILEATKCGKSDADRIANGEDANLSEFPWMALLVYADGVDRTLDCGGSLITDRYVLTAAHCIRVRNKRLVSVRLGEHDIGQITDCVSGARLQRCAPPIEEIDIEEAIYHQDYDPSRFTNDIGLLRLISSVVYRTNIQPICLPITPQSQKARVTHMLIAGWGGMENGRPANILQKARVPVKDNDFCQNIHRLIQMTNEHMCAGGVNEIDTCKGDSGGPLFFPVRYRRSARFVQYGIVSGGSYLCGSNFPDIYVRVTSYLPWIAGNISP